MKTPRTERRSMHLLLVSMLAMFAIIATACGSTVSEVAETATDAADEAAEAVEDVVDGDEEEEAVEDEEVEEEEAMEEEDAMEDEGDRPHDGETIVVALVGNPQIEDIATLTPDNFTADTGINVEFTFLPEDELRAVTTRDVNAGGEQFDVVQIGMFETPQFGAAGNLIGLNSFIADTPEYNVDDLLPAVRNGLSVDGELFSAPVYGESSFIMYRTDLIDNMPEAPTWQEVADIAAAVNTDDVAGICLRTRPGWGDLGATFGTVLNTFGGTYWLANDDGSIGEAQVDQPEFREALQFYGDLYNNAGLQNLDASFNECRTAFDEGQVAIWYDATVAAGLLEEGNQAGNIGYALAPTNVTDTSGWLWAWTMAIPASSSNPDAAWEFISWATSEEYINLAGEEIGWASAPPGTRTSTYSNENYIEAASSFAQRTLDAMNAAPIDNPGTTPRPGLPGVQYVGVPEFQNVGNLCTQEFNNFFAGGSIDDAISACQEVAAQETVG